MFDRQFFSTILPEHVRAEVAANSGKVPIIELYLNSGAVLDLCHVVRLSDAWLAVAHFCHDDTPEETGVAFLPYGTILRVALTMRDENERQIGFSMSNPPLETATGAPVHPSTGSLDVPPLAATAPKPSNG
jgi:hypothetical protein